MKNRKKIIFLFFLISLIFYSNDVFAKEEKLRCKYDYYTNVSDEGNLFSDTGYEGDVIELIIYDDGSQDTAGEPAGDEDIKNWGKDYKSWGTVLLEAVPTNKCPDYILVAPADLWSVTGVNYFGLNVSSDKLVNRCKELSNTSLAPYNQVSVFKNQDIDEEEEETILYKCEYDNYTITVDLTNKKLLISNALAGLNINYEISDELTQNWFSEERGTDECLPTVSCTAKVGTVVTYKIFNDSMEAKEAGYDSCSVKVCAGDDCDSSEYSCMTYNKYITQLDSLYAQAQAQANSTGNTYSEINKLEAKLASLCKGVMNSYTYEENCVKACVHFESDLAKIKTTYGAGIGDGGGSASCSLSERIVGWIFKVIQWIRYLVPVLLILLSVLDFIKAVASNSEDEMKKVGAKFVKRLIVAAIIFLLPLMLEFLLGIFNIDTKDYCLK